MTPELLAMPVPLSRKLNGELAVIVKALTLALNEMVLTSVFADSERWVVDDPPKVAASAALFGIVAGVQLPEVFQSPLAGFGSQVALPATTGPAGSSKSRSAPHPVRRARKLAGGMRRERGGFMAVWESGRGRMA